MGGKKLLKQEQEFTAYDNEDGVAGSRKLKVKRYVQLNERILTLVEAYDPNGTDDFLRGIAHNMTKHRKRTQRTLETLDETVLENTDTQEDDQENTQIVAVIGRELSPGPSQMPLLLPEVKEPEQSMPNRKRKRKSDNPETVRRSKRNRD